LWLGLAAKSIAFRSISKYVGYLTSWASRFSAVILVWLWGDSSFVSS